MRKLLFILFCLVSLVSKGQVYQEMPQYGYRANRMAFDSTLSIPTVCGVPTLKSNVTKKAAIAFDSCNNKFYKYNPKTATWGEIGGIDTTSLSNRINSKADTSALNLKLNITDTSNMLSPYAKISLVNTKLNISDTANKWVNNIYRKNGKDSIFYKIGSTEYGIKDSTGGVQNGRFGNDTAVILMAKIHNDAGVTLTNGQVVRWGSSGTNSDVPSVRLANNKHDSTSANTLGFVKGTINANDTGWVILSGKIEKLNTSAFSNGDIIYLDSINGNWTKTKPVAPYHMVYLGVVIKANSGNGSIFVKCHNGYELDEIHDVLITSKVNNQILAYSDTQKVWKNRNVYSVVDTSSLIATKTNVANKVNISDTSTMLYPYLRKADTTSLSSRINLKMNISDTSTMLSKYLLKTDTATLSTRIDARVKYSDTASMLSPYVRTLTLNGYVKVSDTASMLTNYQKSATAVKYSDTTSTIATKTNLTSKMNYSDTASLSSRINTKLNASDTSSLSSRINTKLSISDTANMLTNYAKTSSVNLKINISDTANMLSPYLRKIDTSSLSNRINLKQDALTFSTGLTNTSGTITNNLSVGVSGGQSVIGGTAASNNLILSSTSNTTKGKLIFGSASAYDQANDRIGVGTTSPTNPLDIIRGGAGTMARNNYESGSYVYNGDMKVGVYTSSTNSAHGAAISFGQTNLLTNSRYAGFDMQYVYSATVASNAWRVNYTERSSAGVVQNYTANILQCYADGSVIINPSTLGVTASAKLLVGTATNAGYMLDVNGTARATQFYLSALNTAPASATATGTTGEIRIDANYIYICTATNTWKRVAIATW